MATRSYAEIHVPQKGVAEDLYALPKYPFYEIYDGTLRIRECSGAFSSNVALELATLLVLYTREHHLGKILGADGRCVLSRNPDTVLAPDISFIRQERIVFGPAWEKFFEGAPDLVVEVTSPSDRLTVVQRKVAQFLAAGTSLAWIIQPRKRTALVYRKDGTMAVVPEDGVLDGEDVIPEFACSLGGLFVL